MHGEHECCQPIRIDLLGFRGIGKTTVAEAVGEALAVRGIPIQVNDALYTGRMIAATTPEVLYTPDLVWGKLRRLGGGVGRGLGAPGVFARLVRAAWLLRKIPGDLTNFLRLLKVHGAGRVVAGARYMIQDTSPSYLIAPYAGALARAGRFKTARRMLQSPFLIKPHLLIDFDLSFERVLARLRARKGDTFDSLPEDRLLDLYEVFGLGARQVCDLYRLAGVTVVSVDAAHPRNHVVDQIVSHMDSYHPLPESA